MAKLFPMAEIARRLDVRVDTIYALVRSGELPVAGIDKSKPGRPANLIDVTEAYFAVENVKSRRKMQRARHVQLEESIKELMDKGRPLEGTPISVGDAARKYAEFRISRQLVSLWVKNGEVTVRRPADGPGRKMLIDESTLWDRLQSYKPRRRKNGQRALIEPERSSYGTRNPALRRNRRKAPMPALLRHPLTPVALRP